MSQMRKIAVTPEADITETQPGPAPMLQWIEIEQLAIDETYQRPLSAHNWKSIRLLANGFRWSRFSPVLCAPIEGGMFAIIDGQHRTHAASLCGFKSVPCQIVQMDSQEQAASFAAVNGNVTKVTSHNLFKAALAAGEEWAVDCVAVAEAAGCKLMMSNGSTDNKQPGQIHAVNMFRKIVDTRPRDTVIKALSILMAAEGYRDNKDIWGNSILEPLLRSMMETPQYLDRPDFLEFLELYDIWDAIDGFEAENKRRIAVGQIRLSRKESIRMDVLNAINEAMVEDDHA